MIQRKKKTILAEALICSLGLIVFAYFIHYEFPVRLISFGALLIPGYIIAVNLKSSSDLGIIIGKIDPFRNFMLLAASGIFLGSIMSILYRSHLGIGLLPESLHLFAFIAALIGSTEELVFRGFIQDHVGRINGPLSVFFGTLSHTAYKCFLFLSPVVNADIDVGFLALYTFISGMVLGTIRFLSGNLIPAITAHALFDILVYAEFMNAPWWVW